MTTFDAVFDSSASRTAARRGPCADLGWAEARHGQRNRVDVHDAGSDGESIGASASGKMCGESREDHHRREQRAKFQHRDEIERIGDGKAARFPRSLAGASPQQENARERENNAGRNDRRGQAQGRALD